MKLPAKFHSFAGSMATRQIDLIGVTICAALTLGGYLIAARPLLNSRDERATREATLIETRQRAARMLGNTRALRTQLADATARLEKIEIPLQTSAAINQRLAELADLAAKCGLEMQYIRPGTLAISQRFAQIPIQISGTGSYGACASFLHQLHDRFPDTGVNGFDLTGSPGDVSTPTSFMFQMDWFVQSPNGPVQNASIDVHH